MNKKFILVVYDISNDKRRTRLHKKLKNFGSPVQYSVFECLLTDEEISKMKAMVFKTIRNQIDRVRFYPICGQCYKNILTTANQAITSEKDIYVI